MLHLLSAWSYVQICKVIRGHRMHWQFLPHLRQGYVAYPILYAYLGTITFREICHTTQGSRRHISFSENRTAMAGAGLILTLVSYVKLYFF